MDVLSGRRALVTGSSRNLGAVIARSLADAGATVAVHHRDSAAEARAVLESLAPATSGSHAVVQADLADAGQARGLVADAADALSGHIDIVVNNAGPYGSTPFVELDEPTFDRVWNVNTRAAAVLAAAAAPAMRDHGWGRIVNVAASSAYVRNRSIYTLANAALITLTEELAVELAPAITVNALAPGQIHESLDDLAEVAPEWAEEVVAATPLGRLVRRPEIGALVVFLCSPAFDGVTGVTVPVDGGLRLATF